jgi:hypothetical protein
MYRSQERRAIAHLFAFTPAPATYKRCEYILKTSLFASFASKMTRDMRERSGTDAKWSIYIILALILTHNTPTPKHVHL